MKKGFIISLIISVICLISIPISIVSFGFSCPPQFDETYYGELPYMFNRLKNGKEGKIVFVGNSALAFGIRPDLLSEELNKEVINFGLYGAIGTKAMMDLSKVNIKKDDIIILSPEISSQGLSLYFSSENMWMSIDGHYEMLDYISKDNRQTMTGNFTSFAASKMSYVLKGHKPIVEGVYTQKSFNINDNEVGYMTYEREYNMMMGGYDVNSLVKFDISYLTSEFINYVNEYAKYVKSKGAYIYYGFVPINNLSNTSSDEEIELFYEKLKKELQFPVLGVANNYIFDYEWFYDNNSHLNSSGMYIYNHQLVEDLKILFEDDSENHIMIPDKPTIPISEYEDGDNSDVSYFNYEKINEGYKITSLNEKGKDKTVIIIPSTYNDLPVISFDASTFQDNHLISEIIIPNNLHGLLNHSFVGCQNLTKLIIQQTDPNKLNVGTSLLDGASNCYIYVKANSYDNFVNHYNWSFYRNKIRQY